MLSPSSRSSSGVGGMGRWIWTMVRHGKERQRFLRAHRRTLIRATGAAAALLALTAFLYLLSFTLTGSSSSSGDGRISAANDLSLAAAAVQPPETIRLQSLAPEEAVRVQAALRAEAQAAVAATKAQEEDAVDEDGADTEQSGQADASPEDHAAEPSASEAAAAVPAPLPAAAKAVMEAAVAEEDAQIAPPAAAEAAADAAHQAALVERIGDAQTVLARAAEADADATEAEAASSTKTTDAAAVDQEDEQVAAESQGQQPPPPPLPLPDTVIALRPLTDPAAAGSPSPSPPPQQQGRRFGPEARSRISRISRVVEQTDLDRAKLNAGGAVVSADQQLDQQQQAEAFKQQQQQQQRLQEDEVEVELAAEDGDSEAQDVRIDAVEQRALDRWGQTDFADRASRYPGGYVDAEGVFVPGESVDPRGWDVAAMKNLTLVWDMGAGGCSGWGLEASHMVLSLEPYIGRLGLVAGGTSAEAFCQGLPEHMLRRLEALRNKPIQRWGQQQGEGGIDVWVSHKPPTRYPRFPYRGAVTVTQQPLFVIGRSMSEVHRVPSSWVRAVQEQVDEVWVPARASRDAFVSATEGMGGVGRVDEKQVHVIPEPIDAELFDAVTVAPLDAEKDLVGLKLRSFNFLSVFKMEERKGWRSLMRAWFEEFSEVDDVTLTLHTYLFNDFNSRDAQRIRQKIREFVETDLQQFPGRDLVARPLPWANLLIHTAELGAEDMPSFYATFSAFVLPTHGEGWGMPLMEAMAMGLPAIATNWGGQLEFMRPSNSYLVPVLEFVPVPSSEAHLFEPGAHAKWAQPSVQVLRKVMRHASSHPEHTVPVAARGRSLVLTKFNTKAVAAVMLRRLTEIYPLVLERRQWASQEPKRSIVRGSHLHTSTDPNTLPPALRAASISVVPEAGMLARRGADVAEEASRARSQAEVDALADALVASQRTAWKPNQAEHAPDLVDPELPPPPPLPTPTPALTIEQAAPDEGVPAVPAPEDASSEAAQQPVAPATTDAVGQQSLAQAGTTRPEPEPLSAHILAAGGLRTSTVPARATDGAIVDATRVSASPPTPTPARPAPFVEASVLPNRASISLEASVRADDDGNNAPAEPLAASIAADDAAAAGPQADDVEDAVVAEVDRAAHAATAAVAAAAAPDFAAPAALPTAIVDAPPNSFVSMPLPSAGEKATADDSRPVTPVRPMPLTPQPAAAAAAAALVPSVEAGAGADADAAHPNEDVEAVVPAPPSPFPAAIPPPRATAARKFRSRGVRETRAAPVSVAVPSDAPHTPTAIAPAAAGLSPVSSPISSAPQLSSSMAAAAPVPTSTSAPPVTPTPPTPKPLAAAKSTRQRFSAPHAAAGAVGTATAQEGRPRGRGRGRGRGRPARTRAAPEQPAAHTS